MVNYVQNNLQTQYLGTLMIRNLLFLPLKNIMKLKFSFNGVSMVSQGTDKIEIN